MGSGRLSLADGMVLLPLLFESPHVLDEGEGALVFENVAHLLVVDLLQRVELLLLALERGLEGTFGLGHQFVVRLLLLLEVRLELLLGLLHPRLKLRQSATHFVLPELLVFVYYRFNLILVHAPLFRLLLNFLRFSLYRSLDFLSVLFAVFPGTFDRSFVFR